MFITTRFISLHSNAYCCSQCPTLYGPILMFMVRINASKTNILWLGSRYIIDNLHEVKVVSSTITTVASAWNLGVVIDSRLTMSDHVPAVCRVGYYRLWQLRPTVKSLPVDTARTLIQAFISNRLDYCNAALCGITDTLHYIEIF